MAKAKLNNDMIATGAGDVTVYIYDSKTREYQCSSNEFLAVGVGLPANACIDAPRKSKAGYAICRAADCSGWECVADHRGETVYSKETGEKMTVSDLGDYSETVTSLSPNTPYDKWNGKGWETDIDAQHAADIVTAEQKKRSLLAEASVSVELLQDAIDLEMATEEEERLSKAWRKYRVQLSRIDTDSIPVSWPERPV